MESVFANELGKDLFGKTQDELAIAILTEQDSEAVRELGALLQLLEQH